MPFTTTGEFSLSVSAWMAEFSLLVYEEPNFAKNMLRFAGFPGFRFYANKSTEAFVAWNEAAVVVAFRGTEIKSVRSFLDLYTDVSLHRSVFQGGMVHSGFRNGLLDVWDLGAKTDSDTPWIKMTGMASFLNKLKSEMPERAFFFTGHSLGAALATLASSLFSGATALYTFGSPMVGDEGFSAKLRIPHFRWVNNRDIITFLPPPEVMGKVLKYFYVHTGVEKFIDAGGVLADPPENRQPGNILDMIRGKQKSDEKPLLDMLIDHMPVSYTVKIWNIMCASR